MPSKDKVLGKIFGDPQKKIIHRLQKRVDEINALGDKYAKMSDEELAEFLAEEQFRIANTVFQTVGYGLEKQAIYARRLDWLQQPAEEDT